MTTEFYFCQAGTNFEGKPDLTGLPVCEFSYKFFGLCRARSPQDIALKTGYFTNFGMLFPALSLVKRVFILSCFGFLLVGQYKNLETPGQTFRSIAPIVISDCMYNSGAPAGGASIPI